MKGKPNLLFLRGICVCQEGFLEALFGGLDVWPVRHRPRFTLALLYPALPTHTDTAGGRVSEQKESKAEGQGKKKKCFSGSDVWESNERPSSNPVARQPKWYAEGISLKLESKQSLCLKVSKLLSWRQSHLAFSNVSLHKISVYNQAHIGI